MNLNKFQKFLISLFLIIFLFSIFYFLFSDKVLAAKATITCGSGIKEYKYPWCNDVPQNIADLVGKFYKYALAAVGVAALGAIVYGGILHTVSAGNPSDQSEAKKWIWGAVSGVALLLGAYLLLYTINPELVKLKEPDVTDIRSTSTESLITNTNNKGADFTKGLNTETLKYRGKRFDTIKECENEAKQEFGNRLIGTSIDGFGDCVVVRCKKDTAYGGMGKGCISTK